MCGICGVVQVAGEPRAVVPAEVLDRMTDLMHHRGPNDRGIYAAPGVALAVRRLSIVDVAGGHQPVASEDGRVQAIQNGELYNHAALRSELAGGGHRFLSRCDTEVLPHLYEDAGPAFASRLRGKFAVAVWDERERRAVLARDRLGVKPLYLARSGDLLVFASELKSVLASGVVDTELDYEAIDAYLALGFVPGPRTPFKQVSKLPPGHFAVVERGSVRIQRYWAYPKPAAAPVRDVDAYGEQLLELLEDAVRARLMSDVPLGAMLSGGLDSSLIVALMARNMSEPVKTFSVGFAEDERSELADARLVAQAFGTDHHELELSLAGDEVDLEQLVWHLDEPLADLSALGFLALSELASRHVTVALSGQGADELFGGYPKHQAARIAAATAGVPAPLRRGLARATRRGPDAVRRAARVVAADDPVVRLLAMSSQLDPELRGDLVRGELAALDGHAADAAVRRLLNGVPDDPLPTTLYLDGQLALVDDMLHYFDRVSMAHSLEVRVPFLDHALVEFAATVPADLKVRRGLTTKYLLKRVAADLVPRQVVEKRKLGFFKAVAASWMSAQMDRAVRSYLLDRDPVSAEFLDQDQVARLFTEYASGGSRRRGRLLLAILMLEIWLSSYLPRAAGGGAPERAPAGLRA